MNVPDRLQTLSQLLRIFDEVRRPLIDQAPSEPSPDFRALAAGRISTAQYFERRIERSLEKLAPHLDRQELEYVRQACFSYVEDDLVHSGLYQLMQSRLQATRKLSHTQEGEADVNQNDSAAKERQELGSEALQQLKRGEITVDEYLESRLENQVKLLKLDRMLTEPELEKMRQLIRDNFMSSPLFRHYTDAMTGKSHATTNKSGKDSKQE